MTPKAIKTCIFVVFLAFLVIGLTGCDLGAQKELKPSADWSRSVAVGEYAVGSLSLAVEGSGERVHLAWPYDLGKGTFLRYLQLDAQAEPVVSRDFNFPGQSSTPRLLLAEPGRLHLFWRNREPGEAKWSLWYAQLKEGELANQPLRVSQPGSNVGSIAVARNPSSEALVAYDESGGRGVYLQRFNTQGQLPGDPLAISAVGKNPSLQVDNAGAVHLVWLAESSFMYTSILPDGTILVPHTRLVDLTLGTGSSLNGPILGLSDGWVYVFWSTVDRSGLDAGAARSEFASFPQGKPESARTQPVWLYPAEDPPYTAYSSKLSLSQLVAPPSAPFESSDFIQHPMVVPGQNAELVVALSTRQYIRMDTYQQIAVAVFSEGEYLGYSMASKTERLSDEPVIYLDEQGSLHLAWREGAAGRQIYFGTTSPSAVANLDRITSGDILNAVLRGGMEGTATVALLPVVGFGWILPGLLLMGIWKLIRDQENLRDLVSWIPLLVSISMYQLFKFATLPTILTYVPFSAWLAIPSSYWMVLRIGVPILIICLAILAANWVRHKRSASAALFYVSFCLTDAFFSLAIYGVNFLGVY